MTFFTDLQKESDKQKQQATGAVQPETSELAQKSAQKVEQKTEQLSKPLSKGMSKDVLKTLSSDEIEALNFRLRKITKTKINAEVPPEWKQRLDDMAYQLGVGKYELVMYIIGRFLGETEA